MTRRSKSIDVRRTGATVTGAHVTGGHGSSSEFSETSTWSPPTKIVAKYLAPYLQERDRLAASSG